MGIVQRESIKLTIVSYLGAALGYVNKILLFTNFLSPDQVGLINIFANISVVYAQFSALGMISAVIRFFPFFEEKDKKHHSFLFWIGVIIMVGFLIMSALFLIFKSAAISYFGKNSALLVDYYYYLIPLALSTVYFNFLDSYARSLLKTVVSTVLNEFVSRLMLTLCVSLYAFKLIDFHQFVILFIIANCILTLLLFIYIAFLKQLFIIPARSKRFRRFFRILMNYGFYSILGILGASVINNVDSLMVASKISLALAGIYTTIYYISTVMVFPYRSMQKISLPLVARYWKDRDMDSMKTLYQKTSLVNMVIGGILFLGLWVNIDSVFKFMPSEYAQAKYAFFFLAIGRYVDLATGLNSMITITSKKFRYDLWFTLLLVILTVLLNLLFIPIWGMMGASFATMISLAVSNGLRLIFVQYFFKMQPFTSNCLWVLLITIAVCCLCPFIPTVSNKYLDIGIKSAIVSVLYMGTILLLKLSPDVNQMAYNFTKLKFLAPKKED
jgi:O-antigen/teichoic acid export membrane protein